MAFRASTPNKLPHTRSISASRRVFEQSCDVPLRIGLTTGRECQASTSGRCSSSGSCHERSRNASRKPHSLPSSRGQHASHQDAPVLQPKGAQIADRLRMPVVSVPSIPALTSSQPQTSVANVAKRRRRTSVSLPPSTEKHGTAPSPSTSRDSLAQTIDNCQTFRSLMHLVLKHEHQFQSHHVVSVLIRLQAFAQKQHIGGRNSRHLVKRMFDLFYQHTKHFSHQDCCSILQATPFLPYRDQTLVQVCLMQVQPHLSTLTSSQLSDIMSSLSTLRHKVPPAWATSWFAATEPHLVLWGARRLSAAVHSCRLLSLRPPTSWLQKHVTRIRHLMPQCSATALALVIRSYGALGCRPSDAWLQQLEQALAEKMDGCRPAVLAAIAQGMGSMRHCVGERWLQTFCAESLENLPGFSPSELVQMLYGIANVTTQPAADWMTAMMIRTRETVDQLSAEDLSTLIYTLAQLRHLPTRPWLASYMSAVSSKATFSLPKHTVNIVYGFARLGIKPARGMLEALLLRSQPKLVAFTAEEMADLLFGLSRLQHVPTQPWLSAFFQQSIPKLPACRPQLLLNMMRATTKLHLVPGLSWFQEYASSCKQQLSTFESKQAEQLFLQLDSLIACVQASQVQSKEEYVAEVQQLQVALEWKVSGITPDFSNISLEEVQLEDVVAKAEEQRVALAESVAADVGSSTMSVASGASSTDRELAGVVSVSWERALPGSVLPEPQVRTAGPQWATGSLAAAMVPGSGYDLGLLPASSHRQQQSAWSTPATLMM